jgi:hypothetical protein
MIVDGQWIDDEEWLEQQAQAVYEAIQKVNAAVESGKLGERERYMFQRYIQYHASFYTPEEFWKSSSAYC